MAAHRGWQDGERAAIEGQLGPELAGRLLSPMYCDNEEEAAARYLLHCAPALVPAVLALRPPAGSGLHPRLLRLQRFVRPPQHEMAAAAACSLRGRLEQQGLLLPDWHRRHGPELLGCLLQVQGFEPAADEDTSAAVAAEQLPERERSDAEELQVRWLRYSSRAAANRALLPPHMEGQALPLLQHCFAGLPLPLCAALLGWQARRLGFDSWRSKALHLDHEWALALACTVTQVALVLALINVQVNLEKGSCGWALVQGSSPRRWRGVPHTTPISYVNQEPQAVHQLWLESEAYHLQQRSVLMALRRAYEQCTARHGWPSEPAAQAVTAAQLVDSVMQQQPAAAEAAAPAAAEQQQHQAAADAGQLQQHQAAADAGQLQPASAAAGACTCADCMLQRCLGVDLTPRLLRGLRQAQDNALAVHLCRAAKAVAMVSGTGYKPPVAAAAHRRCGATGDPCFYWPLMLPQPGRPCWRPRGPDKQPVRIEPAFAEAVSLLGCLLFMRSARQTERQAFEAQPQAAAPLTPQQPQQPAAAEQQGWDEPLPPLFEAAAALCQPPGVPPVSVDALLPAELPLLSQLVLYVRSAVRPLGEVAEAYKGSLWWRRLEQLSSEVEGRLPAVQAAAHAARDSYLAPLLQCPAMSAQAAQAWVAEPSPAAAPAVAAAVACSEAAAEGVASGSLQQLYAVGTGEAAAAWRAALLAVQRVPGLWVGCRPCPLPGREVRLVRELGAAVEAAAEAAQELAEFVGDDYI